MKSVENNAAQDGQLPLHYAAEKGVSLNVWKLLLEANPKAAATVDTACRCAPNRTAPHTRYAAAPPRVRLLISLLCYRNRPATPMYCTARLACTQEGELPLHYAAANDTPFEVMELLLDANREAAAAADKARGPANTAPPTPCRRRRAVCRCSPLGRTSLPLPDQCCATRLVRRTRSFLCTTPPPRARRSV